MAAGAQVDPYAQIAKPVVADDPYATMAGPVVAPPAPAPPPPQSWAAQQQQQFDTSTHRNPGDSISQSIVKWGVGGLLQPFVHPIETAKGIIDAIPGNPDFPETSIKLPNGQVQGAPQNPMLTRLDQVAPEYREGGLPLVAAHAGTDALTTWMMGKGLEAPFAPRELPSLTTPAEASAREITRAVSPMQAEAPEFAHNVERHWGDLNDYAKRTNNPLQTHADYVKAATGAGTEALDHYKTQIVEPNAARTVGVPPEYQGPQASVPGTASIGDINSRVNAINAEEKLLNAGSGGDLAAKKQLLGLSAEKSRLLDILHQSLGDLTGNTPEAIQQLRQKGPSLLDIGDTMNRADYRRLVTPDAGNVPGSKIGILAKMYNEMRGGPVKVADSRLVKAAKNAPMQPTPLPSLNPPAQPLPALNTDFLHANDLEQAAQQSAVQRAQQLADLRAKQQADYLAAVRAKTAANAKLVGKPVGAPRGLPPLQ